MPKDPICGMDVSERSALKIKYNGQYYYFCSKHCLEKFSKEKNISCDIASGCNTSSGSVFYKNKTFIVTAILFVFISASYGFSWLAPFRNAFFDYFKVIWWAVLLGFLIGGLIDYYIPREYISLILARGGKLAIVNAVLLGFFMSACSHGILALSIQLHKKGASNPSVVAFLLASPWANMALTIMLIGFFGFKALFIIFAAIFIALITGFIFQFLEKKGLIETNSNTVAVDAGFSIRKDIAIRLKSYKFSANRVKNDIKGIFNGMVSLSNMVLWWILIGMGIASFAGAYIPTDFFQNYMGPTVLGLFVTLALATVMEVCSEGSAPMAFEIFRQTKALGNSFVFLMAGVATDYTEIGLLWHNVGKRTAIWLPIITVPQVILFGFLANFIF
ncbi:MAG: permease [Candidatus Omnitrophota bacterium]